MSVNMNGSSKLHKFNNFWVTKMHRTKYCLKLKVLKYIAYKFGLLKAKGKS